METKIILKKYKVGPSNIHGKGLKATKNLTRNERVALLVNEFDMLVSLMKLSTTEPRTTAGKYVNHSDDPNCRWEKDTNNLNWYLTAAQDIKKDKELTLNYRVGPWFVEKELDY